MKARIVLLLLLVSFLLTGCKEGSASIAYSWTSAPSSFVDYNPSAPLLILKNQPFPSQKGTYYFQYTILSSYTMGYVTWSANYSIEPQKGFKPQNEHVVISLQDIGPWIDVQFAGASLGGEPSSIPNSLELAPPPLLLTPEVEQVTYTQDYKITLRAQRIQ